ncbi:hypothetical protein EVAR_65817_1 [Eumeta japonica]|uniref:Uncharacterized protein n=1 Tax=Eumeta variegata TaxID=151549 RepID=A0A4C1ZP28_EUMVA|nr:hypothetical protein EVAR_65817_1 [Eumeta japonica]
MEMAPSRRPPRPRPPSARFALILNASTALCSTFTEISLVIFSHIIFSKVEMTEFSPEIAGNPANGPRPNYVELQSGILKRAIFVALAWINFIPLKTHYFRQSSSSRRSPSSCRGISNTTEVTGGAYEVVEGREQCSDTMASRCGAAARRRRDNTGTLSRR